MLLLLLLSLCGGFGGFLHIRCPLQNTHPRFEQELASNPLADVDGSEGVGQDVVVGLCVTMYGTHNSCATHRFGA